MNPFEPGRNTYVPYRVKDQFSLMQQELVSLNYDAKNVPSKSSLGRSIKGFCWVCSSTKKTNLEPYASVYEFNTYLGKIIVNKHDQIKIIDIHFTFRSRVIRT